MAVAFVCPLCSKSVDPLAPNSEMNAANKQWQHKECARVTATALAESAEVAD
jgi:hypothetical protein